MNNIQNKDKTQLVQDCCICGGQTVLCISGSCYLKVNGKEYRVYYHKACLSEHTKKIVEESLRSLAGIPKGAGY